MTALPNDLNHFRFSPQKTSKTPFPPSIVANGDVSRLSPQIAACEASFSSVNVKNTIALLITISKNPFFRSHSAFHSPKRRHFRIDWERQLPSNKGPRFLSQSWWH